MTASVDKPSTYGPRMLCSRTRRLCLLQIRASTIIQQPPLTVDQFFFTFFIFFFLSTLICVVCHGDHVRLKIIIIIII